jgi:hypothetical protein
MIEMIQVNADAYVEMLGNIDAMSLVVSVECISQCTGCMCNCRCSCKGGVISDFEWEGL